MISRICARAWLVAILASALLPAMGGARAPMARAQGPAAAAAPDSTWVDVPLQHARQLMKDSHYAAADSACRALLAEAERRDGPVSKSTARVLAQLVAVLQRSGHGTAPEALELAKRDLRVREQAFGPDDVAVAVAQMDLGNVHGRRGEYADAVAWTEKAVAVREKHLGPDARLVGDALANLGVYRYLAGDLKGAREPMERALAITEKALGSDHPELAGPLQNLSGLCMALGDPQAALAYAERAVPLVEHAAEDRKSIVWAGPDEPRGRSLRDW